MSGISRFSSGSISLRPAFAMSRSVISSGSMSVRRAAMLSICA